MDTLIILACAFLAIVSIRDYLKVRARLRHLDRVLRPLAHNSM
jgi:hypothetical protein